MPIIEKKYNVAVKTNEKGECVDIAKVKVVGSQEYQQLIRETNQHKEKILLDSQLDKDNVDKRFKDILGHLTNQDLIIAKNYFDNLCDRGLCDTNDDFECVFTNYVDKGILFDLHSAYIPPQYIKVLERLGYKL